MSTVAAALLGLVLVAYLLYRLMRWARGHTRGAYVLGAVLSNVTQGAVVQEAKEGRKRNEGEGGDPPSEALADVMQPNVVDTDELDRRIESLRSLGNGEGDRAAKAQRAIDLIRTLRPYRWAGLYDVLSNEIAVIAWSGPQAPTYPRFPIDKGLSGACVSSRQPVIVQDVTGDRRYLTTIGGPRGEMIQPVLDRFGAVVGTIDVESDRVNAFGSRDEELLAACAKSLVWLWPGSG
jgi:putative methionine-R-sulfoxide reductase with GAF domain